MRRKRTVLAFLLAWSSVCRAENLKTADASLPTGFDPARHMRVSEVKEGMTGYGVSVFKGTKLERFDVTVLSILHNFNPKYDVVLIDCKGANLEHTGSVAGMSGSPVYLKDDQGRERMIGAFAYGWPLMKDPYAGVQPIEYLLAIPTTRPAGEGVSGKPHDGRGTVRWSVADLMPLGKGHGAGVPLTIPNRQTTVGNFSEVFSGDAARLQPLATPLMTGGMPRAVVEQLNIMLAPTGMVAMQAGGIGGGDGDPQAPPVKIEPGSVLAVPLMTGDAEMTALGTCTEVIGDRVLGFGHSFNNEGPIALPMGGGRINAVIANLTTSFKIGALRGIQGTLLADQTVGVAGKTGAAPAMIPMDLRVIYTDASAEQRFHFMWQAQQDVFSRRRAGCCSGLHDAFQLVISERRD